MTRIEFVSFLLNNGIKNATIVTSPDYNGGERLKVYLNTSVVQNLWEVPEEYQDIPNGYYVLHNCEYILWQGDTTDITKHKNDVFSENCDDAVFNILYKLEDLIIYKVNHERRHLWNY
jgi:hypothetical protein